MHGNSLATIQSILATIWQCPG